MNEKEDGKEGERDAGESFSASGRDHVSFERFRGSVVLCVNVASR